MSPVRVLLRTLAMAGLSAALIAPVSVARADPSASELSKQINAKSAELEKKVEAYNRLNEEIKKTKADSATLTVKLGPLQQQVDEARTQVGQLAATAYMTGGLRTAGIVLDTTGPDELASNLGTLEQLARDRQQKVSGFSESQRRYLAEKAELDATLARQTAQAKNLDDGKKKIQADLDKLYAMRKAAYGKAQSSGSHYSGKVPSVSGKAGVAVRYAYNAIGTPYVWAADGPDGYDCSGLTMAAWRAAGKSLPHNAAMQWDAVSHIGRGSLQPGDLVFYSGLGHVALYVGGGKVIHAPQAGEDVKQASVDMMTPYGYGRVR